MSKECGTLYMYSLGCRCDLCKKSQIDYRNKRAEKVHLAGKVSHGTLTGYKTHKCRCNECTKAHTEYQRNYRMRHKAEVMA